MLNGSASSGSISNYQWTEISGPSNANLISANSSITLAEPLLLGQYLFQLTVKDSQGNSSTAKVSVTVTVDPKLPPGLLVFPNPAVDHLTLQINNDSAENLIINVFDMAGRHVIRQEVFKAEGPLTQQINTSALASGIYALQLIAGGRLVAILKFAKQ